MAGAKTTGRKTAKTAPARAGARATGSGAAKAAVARPKAKDKRPAPRPASPTAKAKPAPHPRPAAKRLPAKPARTRPAARSLAAKTSAEPARLGRLHQVALVAHDLDASVAFYRDVLGLGFMDRFDPPGLAFFNLGGGLRLMLSASASEATLYFRVDDIDAAFAAFADRGVPFLQKPHLIHRDDAGAFGKKGTEEWMAFFKDPSGNLLALVGTR